LDFEFQIVPEIPVIKVGFFKDAFEPVFKNFKETVNEEDAKVCSNIDDEPMADEIEKLKDVEKLKTKLMTVDPYKFEIVVSNLISHVGFPM